MLKLSCGDPAVQASLIPLATSEVICVGIPDPVGERIFVDSDRQKPHYGTR